MIILEQKVHHYTALKICKDKSKDVRLFVFPLKYVENQVSISVGYTGLSELLMEICEEQEQVTLKE